MTWQRIDENTYIDDTLVTCAEYQLFIDEMREQGKYHQPDHWTSYQFPERQAREPILGMRYSDAVTFCGWLTNRNSNNWHYRLPADAEAKEYLLKLNNNLLPFGYWIMGNDKQYQFAWISFLPIGAMLEHVLDLASTFDLLDPNSEDSYTYQLAFKLSRERPLDISFDIATIKKIDFTDELGIHLEITKKLKQGIENIYNRAFSSRSEIVLICELAATITEDLSLVFGKAFPLRRNNQRAKDHFEVISDAYTLMADFTVDIAILQGRIAGRFPAFEGIRLVKERIR